MNNKLSASFQLRKHTHQTAKVIPLVELTIQLLEVSQNIITIKAQ